MTGDESQWNLLVTRYFEYAIRGATCAGVRERATGEWLERHYALGNQVSLVPASKPVPGARWDLLVSALLTEVQVGPVLGIERPSIAVINDLTLRSIEGRRAAPRAQLAS